MPSPKLEGVGRLRVQISECQNEGLFSLLPPATVGRLVHTVIGQKSWSKRLLRVLESSQKMTQRINNTVGVSWGEIGAW